MNYLNYRDLYIHIIVYVFLYKLFQQNIHDLHNIKLRFMHKIMIIKVLINLCLYLHDNDEYFTLVDNWIMK